MRYPYDMWAHLISIDNPYDYTSIPQARELWHLIWRGIFNTIHISSSEILLRAKIIHITQTLISFGSIYLFSLVLARNIYINSPTIHHKYIAYWSTIIWFTIFATFSMYYHHTWIMWYSISYQITLPLFWYITALSLILYFEDKSILVKLFYTFQILILSLFILKIHSMEYIYYILYILILSAVFFKNTLYLFKKYYYIIIPILLLLLYFFKSNQGDNTRLINYLYSGDFKEIYHLILYEGSLIVNGLNRANSAINELMYVTLLMTIISFILLFRDRNREIDIKIYFFILLTSMFILIPIFSITAGIYSLLTKINVVNRVYYSSSIYLLLPISLYYISSQFKKNTLYIFNILIIMTLLLTVVYSKYISNSHNYYKNIESLKQSIDADKVNFNLSQNDIFIIKKELDMYKKNNPNALFCARGDILLVLKFIYKENTYWRGRRANISKEEFYKFCAINHIKECIFFEVPKSFLPYKPYW
jgi:hypothetical protein